MKTCLALVSFVLAFSALPCLARDVAGQFDYYVLSLSWSPSWCAGQSVQGGGAQCDAGRKLGFTAHGLWPQYETGWPSDCRTNARDPSRRETQAMADTMGSPGLVWYQWKKHGRCTGLSAQDYYDLTRKATQQVRIPPVLSQLSRDVRLPSNVIEDALIEANPKLTRNGITVTCSDRALQEVRICLTKDLEPRECGRDARRDCQGSFLMPAPR